MGRSIWSFGNRSSKSDGNDRETSAAERALRVKMICQAVRAGTYRVSTGELADRFLSRLAAGELRAAVN